MPDSGGTGYHIVRAVDRCRRRLANVADAKWWTFWEKTGVGLLGLGAILAAVSAETRVAAIVVGGVGFLILIVGLTGQLRAGKMGGEVVPSPTRLRGVGESDPPAAEATTPATEADTKFLAGPRGKLPIYFYGPTSWFPWSGAVQTDVTLRVAVALPGVLEMRGASVGVTRLHGEPREHLIEGALNLSSLTTWLRACWRPRCLHMSRQRSVSTARLALMTMVVLSPRP